MTHVLVGNHHPDHDLLVDAANNPRSTVDWVVPKAARPGDEAVVFIGGYGFVATGEVMSPPTKGSFNNRSIYRADLGEIKMLDPPVPVERVLEQIPEWKWPTYPRSYTTPSPDVAQQLVRVIEEYSSK